jgi:hypothetical protein
MLQVAAVDVDEHRGGAEQHDGFGRGDERERAW